VIHIVKVVARSNNTVYKHLNTTKTVTGNTNTRLVVAYTSGEESTGVRNRRLHLIDDGYIAIMYCRGRLSILLVISIHPSVICLMYVL
jgi:hypothetical protein